MNWVEAFKSADAASYDRLARDFDHQSQAYSTYAVDALLRRAGVGTAGTVLDIGCGTGVVTLAAAALQGPGARTIGVDLSDGMLAVAREKSRLLGVEGRIEFVKCDAENLLLGDASVDAATSLYAFRHFPDPDAAAREAFRVLRPGGRCAIAVGAGPSFLSRDGVAAALARIPRALRGVAGRELSAPRHLDGLVDRILPAPSRPEVASWTRRRKPYTTSVATMLRAAGFVDVAGGWLGRSYLVETIEDFWELQATFSSTARKRIADAPAERVAELRDIFRAECEAVLRRGGRLVYRVGAALVSGAKPSGAGR